MTFRKGHHIVCKESVIVKSGNTTQVIIPEGEKCVVDVENDYLIILYTEHYGAVSLRKKHIDHFESSDFSIMLHAKYTKWDLKTRVQLWKMKRE